MKMKYPVILHIPHASTRIPEEYRSTFCVDLEREILRMTDLYTDDLFDAPVERLVFPVSRLVCDVERFRDDRQEEMADIGMGAVYTRSHDLSQLRTVTEEQKEQILKKWYDPHHARLTSLVEEKLEVFGKVLIVDCHSFSAEALLYEKDQTSVRPDICIGTDPFHTPGELALELEHAFRDLGYSAALDFPYAGAIVPDRFYQKDRRVYAVMIEVNRGLYMNTDGTKTRRYPQIKEDIRTVLDVVL